MINAKLRTIRSLFCRLRHVELRALGREGALLIVSAGLLSSIASAQVPTTTGLPYLLQNPAPNVPGLTAVYVAPTATTIMTIPKQVGLSGFGSLLGGGLASAISIPTISPAETAALTLIDKLSRIRSQATAKNFVNEYYVQEADQSQSLKAKVPTGCSDALAVMKLRIASRAQHQALPADSSGCLLPEEDQAEQAQEELEALEESNVATEDALDTAAAAAEGSLAAAEVAEEALEGVLTGIEVLEIFEEALAIF